MSSSNTHRRLAQAGICERARRTLLYVSPDQFTDEIPESNAARYAFSDNREYEIRLGLGRQVFTAPRSMVYGWQRCSVRGSGNGHAWWRAHEVTATTAAGSTLAVCGGRRAALGNPPPVAEKTPAVLGPASECRAVPSTQVPLFIVVYSVRLCWRPTVNGSVKRILRRLLFGGSLLTFSHMAGRYAAPLVARRTACLHTA